MRMSPAEYADFIAKNGLTSQLPPQSAAALALEPADKKSRTAKSMVDEATNALQRSRIVLHHEPGARFGAGFIGAHVLSLNELLRIDLRVLNKYRKAWHAKALLACQMQFGPRIPTFDRKVRLTAIRSASRRLDGDAVASTFKFATDGFREAGLIRDDDPDSIDETIRLKQFVGPDAVALLFEVIEEEPAPVPPLFSQLIQRSDS